MCLKHTAPFLDDAIAWQVVRAACVQMNGKVQDTTQCWSCQLCEGIKCVCIKASSVCIKYAVQDTTECWS